ncbi:MAG: hypothetical protein H3C51_05660 [Rubellimicrobium sp.]|nr:hypothetical protein [Rubellimicrobium sp.]
MILTRREALVTGGAIAALATLPLAARADGPVIITMKGADNGARVWFSPAGLAVAPGTTIRFENGDAGNSHTATAYSPDIDDRQLRIPPDATAWDSDYLLPGDTFEVTLTVPGVYDFYCRPHEMAGMVGRIVVGTPDDAGFAGAAADSDDLPDAALAGFPAVADILAQGSVEGG